MQPCENGNCHPDASENVVTQRYGIFKEDIGQSEKKAGGGTIYADETVRCLGRSRNVEGVRRSSDISVLCRAPAVDRESGDVCRTRMFERCGRTCIVSSCQARVSLPITWRASVS
jgi:hypothetical protein